MKIRTVASISACAFLLVLVQLIAVLATFWVGIVCGALIAILSFLLSAFFQVQFQTQWAAVLLPTASSLVGVALAFFTQPKPMPALWLAPMLALALSLTIVAFRSLRSRRCSLCNRRLGSGVAFACPRCNLLVCDNCWVFEYCRCSLCEQNRVPVFTPDARWWDKQFGPRTAHGRCQLCMTPAQEADLRACRKCGRPQCRACWDFANGQCSRCQWTVEDLPKPLQAYMIRLARPENDAPVSPSPK